MSDSSVPVNTLTTAAMAGAGGGYQLSDDLARLCLPQEFKDSYRNLAWVNSICALFLIIGIVGLKAPKVITKPLSEISEPVPVVLVQPEEQPKPVPQEANEEPETTTDQPVETPQVVTVVAPADAKVAFAIPVQGAVAVASQVRFATPPPPITSQQQSAPKVIRFNPATSDGGYYPPPAYPAAALRNRYQGTVTITFAVDEMGKVSDAKVDKTSGFTMLDNAALEAVGRWRFPPGPLRLYEWPCVFKMQ